MSRLSGKTRVIGLFGSPVAHSRSPVMQNTVFKAMGLDFAYLAFDVGLERAGEAIRAIRTLGLCGANVTMPLKRAVVPYLDALSPAAALAGAVNVIVNEHGHLTGHLTDGTGFMLSLDEAGVAYQGRAMTIIGAGGAGIAVAIQAAFQGVDSVTFFNQRDRFYDAGKTLAAQLCDETDCVITIRDLADHQNLAHHVAETDILINATPIGMDETSTQTALPDLSDLRPEQTVCDLIYVPRQTKLLKQAAARGCTTVSGIGMQLYQAVPAFRMWTGQDIDIDIARQALLGKDVQ